MTDNEPIEVIRSRGHEDSASKNDLQCMLEEGQDPTTMQGEQKGNDMEAKYKQDVPPDGGYGWVCVACVFWINAHTWGINSVCSTC